MSEGSDCGCRDCKGTLMDPCPNAEAQMESEHALRTRLAESEAREEREEQLLAEIARLRDALDKHNRKESK